MSISALALTLYHSQASYSNRLVLIAIANFEGEHGAYPSIDTIGRLAGGLNRRTVQRSIDALIAMGELTEIHRNSKTNLYRIALRCPDDCDRSPNHRKLDGGGVQTTPDKTSDEIGTNYPEWGGVQTTPGAVYAPPKPLVNHIEPLSKKAKRSKSAPFALPDGWQPKPETKAKFGTKWVKIEYESTLEAFIEFSLAKGSKWVDWDLAFQSWCRKAEGWAKPGPSKPLTREEQALAEQNRNFLR